jgi:hypothetical protein
MFRRLLIEDWTVIFTLAAFATALSVYLTLFIRALLMRRSQTDHLASLPFADEGTDANPDTSRHE